MKLNKVCVWGEIKVSFGCSVEGKSNLLRWLQGLYYLRDKIIFWGKKKEIKTNPYGEFDEMRWISIGICDPRCTGCLHILILNNTIRRIPIPPTKG